MKTIHILAACALLLALASWARDGGGNPLNMMPGVDVHPNAAGYTLWGDLLYRDGFLDGTNELT